MGSTGGGNMTRDGRAGVPSAGRGHVPKVGMKNRLWEWLGACQGHRGRLGGEGGHPGRGGLRSL